MSKPMTINIWHPVDGKWRHIFQVYTEGSLTYYTDGRKETPEEEGRSWDQEIGVEITFDDDISPYGQTQVDDD